MQWYYTVQGERQGPVDDAGLEDLVRQGVIRDNTYVWREGLSEWQLYGAVKPKPAPTPLPPPSIEQSPAGAGGPGAPAPARPSASRPHAAPPLTAKPAADGSKSYFFYYPVLRALGDGRVIRTCVVWGLKIGAVVAILAGLLIAFTILSPAQGFGGGSNMLAAILLAVVVLATSLCLGQVYWYRAGSVAALEESDYTVIPIASILFRTAGESGATGLAGLGAGACLFLWLSPAGGLPSLPLPSLPFPIAVSAPTPFVTGIVVVLYSFLLALLSLLAGYLAAEWTAVLVDIAGNIHKIRGVAEKAE